MFAGVCFKVRAIHAMGSFDLANDNSEDQGFLISSDVASERIRVSSKSNLTLSLVVMPFSWDWQRSQWW